jgi:hypothetical protein
MRPLNLDFVDPPPKSNRLGWIVLSVALAVFIATGRYYFAQNAERDRAQAIIAVGGDAVPADNSRPPAADRVAPDVRALAEELDRVERLLERPASSLGLVFRELEATADSRIALLSIQSAAAGKELRISGEAIGVVALARLVDRLAARPVFAAVYLASHEWRRIAGRDVVIFTLVARWAEEAT